MQTRQQKEIEVGRLREQLEGANSLMVVDYRGLTVADANDLRGRLRQAGGGRIRYQVTKNRLLKRAIKDTAHQALEQYLTGPSALAIAYDEPSALAKVLVHFSDQTEAFEIKGGLVEGEVADAAMIQRLAELPSMLELRGMLAGTVQAPLRNLASTLYAVLGNLRNALEQRQAQLEAQS